MQPVYTDCGTFLQNRALIKMSFPPIPTALQCSLITSGNFAAFNSRHLWRKSFKCQRHKRSDILESVSFHPLSLITVPSAHSNLHQRKINRVGGEPYTPISLTSSAVYILNACKLASSQTDN